MRSYTFPDSLALTNSTTKPMVNVVTGGNRIYLYEVLAGSSDDPVSFAARFAIQRCTTAGTPASNPTPEPLDEADAAATATLGRAVFSAGPTLGNKILQWGLNQQNTSRWVAKDGKELVSPTTSGHGLAFMNPFAGTAYVCDYTLQFME